MKIKAKLWSNTFFVLPLFFSILNKLIFHSLLIIFTILSSSLYHIHDEKKYRKLDYFFATSLVLYNIYLLFLSEFKQPYFTFAMIFVILGFLVKYKAKRPRKLNYNFYHSVWHLFCSLITLVCVLAFIN